MQILRLINERSSDIVPEVIINSAQWYLRDCAYPGHLLQWVTIIDQVTIRNFNLIVLYDRPRYIRDVSPQSVTHTFVTLTDSLTFRQWLTISKIISEISLSLSKSLNLSVRRNKRIFFFYNTIPRTYDNISIISISVTVYRNRHEMINHEAANDVSLLKPLTENINQSPKNFPSIKHL